MIYYKDYSLLLYSKELATILGGFLPDLWLQEFYFIKKDQLNQYYYSSSGDRDISVFFSQGQNSKEIECCIEMSKWLFWPFKKYNIKACLKNNINNERSISIQDKYKMTLLQKK